MRLPGLRVPPRGPPGPCTTTSPGVGGRRPHQAGKRRSCPRWRSSRARSPRRASPATTKRLARPEQPRAGWARRPRVFRHRRRWVPITRRPRHFRPTTIDRIGHAATGPAASSPRPTSRPRPPSSSPRTWPPLIASFTGAVRRGPLTPRRAGPLARPLPFRPQPELHREQGLHRPTGTATPGPGVPTSAGQRADEALPQARVFPGHPPRAAGLPATDAARSRPRRLPPGRRPGGPSRSTPGNASGRGTRRRSGRRFGDRPPLSRPPPPPTAEGTSPRPPRWAWCSRPGTTTRPGPDALPFPLVCGASGPGVRSGPSSRRERRLGQSPWTPRPGRRILPGLDHLSPADSQLGGFKGGTRAQGRRGRPPGAAPGRRRPGDRPVSRRLPRASPRPTAWRARSASWSGGPAWRPTRRSALQAPDPGHPDDGPRP